MGPLVLVLQSGEGMKEESNEVDLEDILER